MAGSLRDQLSEAFAEHVEKEEPVQQPATAVPGDVPSQEGAGQGDAAAAGQEQRPGRTAGRARDENGRLLPGKAVRPQESAAEPEKPAQPQVATAQQTATPAAAQRPPRPSSWKKDYWDHWEKLDPAVAAYINQREQEAVKGVSTYKAEYDRLKPLGEVMQEFQPLLQQHGIEPTQWIKNLGTAHKTLALGNPQEKLSMFLRLAQDYQVPLHALFQQGQDGRVYFNPQVQAYQAPQQQAQQPDIDKLIDAKLAERSIAQTIAQFEAQAPEKFPHYEAVKPTMAGLLQAELATDLEDAYQQALRHPRHSELYAQIQEQESREKAAKEAAEKAKQVARAKSQAVSTRTSTPTASSSTQGPKGIRAHLEQAFDEHAGGGRV